MSKPSNVTPLQTIANQSAVKLAEAQFRLANLFTPYQFVPTRADFDRVAEFLDDPYKAFPQPTDAIKTSLDRTIGTIAEARAILSAFKAQGTEPTLSADQLFTTAQANVAGNRANAMAYSAAS